MKLYDYFRSSASYRVRIGLALKGLSVDEHMIDLRTGDQHKPAYKHIAHSGLVPALETDTGETFGQSLAILYYLDQVQPEPKLFPADPLHHARALEMALTVACDIHPLNNLRVLKYLKDNLGADQPAVDAWYANWLQTGFATLEQLVLTHGGDFCLGNRISIADVFLVPQMLNARRFKVDVSQYPTLVTRDSRLTAMPAFQKAMPSE